MKEKMLKDTIRKIERNYRDLEASLVNQLNLETPNHQYTTGTYREIVWKGLFEMMIPKKYCIEQGIFIIDSYGNMSKEVDLAVFDETYTPYIFNFGKINRHSPYLSITLHKCYPYYLFGISTFPNSAYHTTARRKFSITIV